MANEGADELAAPNDTVMPTAAAVLLIVGEPATEDHRSLILEKISKGFKSWDIEASGCDINEALRAIATEAPVGKDGLNGEHIVEHQSETLYAQVLVNPQVQTVRNALKKFLLINTLHKHLIYAGHAFQGSGGWILQDDVFSYNNFAHCFREADVENGLKKQSGGTLSIHTFDEGDWSNEHIAKQDFSKLLQIAVNPEGKLTEITGILQFTAYVSYFVKVKLPQDLLQSTEVVGNIRFSKPTLYIFPGCQGDSALFGVSGFNLLINGGYSRKACFWDFTRHLDRIDAMLLTHLGADNLFGVSNVIQRKVAQNVHPEIGFVYFNAVEKSKHSPNGDTLPEADSHKDASLLVNLAEEGIRLVESLKQLGHPPSPCMRNLSDPNITPINLYHKVGHGTLDMYVLNPVQDSKELKDFLHQWNKQTNHFSSAKSAVKVNDKSYHIPLPNMLSICALLVWRPANANESINRILFPGSAPQYKVFEGLERLKHLDVLKHAQCTANSLNVSSKPSSRKVSSAGKLSSRPVSAKPIQKTVVEKTEKKMERKPRDVRSPKVKDKKEKKDAEKSPRKRSPSETPVDSATASKEPTPPVSKEPTPPPSKEPTPPPSKEPTPPPSKEPTPPPFIEPTPELDVMKEGSPAVDEDIVQSGGTTPREESPVPLAGEHGVAHDSEEHVAALQGTSAEEGLLIDTSGISAPAPIDISSSEDKQEVHDEVEEVPFEDITKSSETQAKTEPLEAWPEGQVQEAPAELGSPEPLPDPDKFDATGFEMAAAEVPLVEKEPKPIDRQIADEKDIDTQETEKEAEAFGRSEEKVEEIEEALDSAERAGSVEDEVPILEQQKTDFEKVKVNEEKISEEQAVKLLKNEDLPEAEPVLESSPEDLMEQKEEVAADETVPKEEVMDKVDADEAVAIEEVIDKIAADEAVETVPEEEVMDKVLADEAVPSKEVIDEVAEDEAVPRQEVIDEVAADEAVPKEEVMDKVVADEAVPKEEVIDELAADQAVPKEEVIDEVAADEAVPKEDVMDKVPEDEAVPRQEVIDEVAADEAAPKEEVIDKVAADEAAPKEEVIDEVAADQAVPKEEVIDEVAAEEAVPKEALMDKVAADEAVLEEKVIDKMMVENQLTQKTELEHKDEVVSETLVEEQLEVIETHEKEEKVTEAPAYTQIDEENILQDAVESEKKDEDQDESVEGTETAPTNILATISATSTEKETDEFSGEETADQTSMIQEQGPETKVEENVEKETQREEYMSTERGTVCAEEPEEKEDTDFEKAIAKDAEIAIKAAPVAAALSDGIGSELEERDVQELVKPAVEEHEEKNTEPKEQKEIMADKDVYEETAEDEEKDENDLCKEKDVVPETDKIEVEEERKIQELEKTPAKEHEKKGTEEQEEDLTDKNVYRETEEEDKKDEGDLFQEKEAEPETEMVEEIEEEEREIQALEKPAREEQAKKETESQEKVECAVEKDVYGETAEEEKDVEPKYENVEETGTLPVNTQSEGEKDENSEDIKVPLTSKQDECVLMEESKISRYEEKLEGSMIDEPTDKTPIDLETEENAAQVGGKQIHSAPEPNAHLVDTCEISKKVKEDQFDEEEEKEVVTEDIKSQHTETDETLPPEVEASDDLRAMVESAMDEQDTVPEDDAMKEVEKEEPLEKERVFDEIQIPKNDIEKELAAKSFSAVIDGEMHQQDGIGKDKDDQLEIKGKESEEDEGIADTETPTSPLEGMDPDIEKCQEPADVNETENLPHLNVESRLLEETAVDENDIQKEIPSEKEVTPDIGSEKLTKAELDSEEEDEDTTATAPPVEEISTPGEELPVDKAFLSGPLLSDDLRAMVEQSMGEETSKQKSILQSEVASSSKPDLLSDHMDDERSTAYSHASEKTTDEEFDPLKEWGKPMGLPAPPPPPADESGQGDKAKKPRPASTSKTTHTRAKKPAADSPKDTNPNLKKPKTTTKTTPRTGTPTSNATNGKREKSADNKVTEARRRPMSSTPVTATKTEVRKTITKSTTKHSDRVSSKSRSTPPLGPVTPFYLDLTYVPYHGSPHYCDVDFFRRVRARYYVFSGLHPCPNTLNALLEAKMTWEEKDIPVTIIPTYDTDTLRHWMGMHRDQLGQLKIDVAPSASRCTIQLQDHETSCAAYRLEF
ncbi:microtubule-associated protein futsch [Lingula anatina]|uniref:Microtubule-associated protein futsch n=1 Tax=Lingula anatina TaxID=7574 RepID=A0A1S3H6V0_LINAN|nr:microtubule-associated protein futsch [Lingula anatina]|eukprot:XP_013381707.1 microtubule-associated protein futsch [Lingula anatina]